MKRLTKTYFLPAIALILFGAVLGVQLDAYTSDDDALEQFEKIRDAFVTIDKYYVDSVEAERMTEAGVKGMLDELDPHSSYIPANQVRDVRDQYEGSFGGVGILFEPADTARVISPVADGPSEKVGIMAGDRIVEIEDSSAVGLSANEIQDQLKGETGTEVTLTVYRPVSDENLTFTIERGEVPLRSITSSYMVDDKTGYIGLERFAMSTYDEFIEKTDTLKEQGMERLVLDLRGNPGGVMQSAIKIADELLGEQGMTIVETRGRQPAMNDSYGAESGGALDKEPVIVLVDAQSASASEILSGALQDHDRALLVGQRTFGKGLIQKQFDLADGSLLQMTVGRYYTPTGRLIQTPYEGGDAESYRELKQESMRKALFNAQEYKDSIPDSLTYETDHGRTVFGGGGVMPDYIVQPDTTSLTTFIQSSALDQVFARHWFIENETDLRGDWRDREQEFRSSYEVSDETVDAFWDYAEEEDILSLTTNADSADANEQVYLRSTAEEVDDVVANRVKGHLAGELYGRGADRPILNETDPVFERAMSLWSSSQELAAYHSSSPASSSADKNE
ncbi:MAG: S41 family peptidase [Salinibacter sp.]